MSKNTPTSRTASASDAYDRIPPCSTAVSRSGPKRPGRRSPSHWRSSRSRRLIMGAVASVVSTVLIGGITEITLRICWEPPAGRMIHTWASSEYLIPDAQLGHIARRNAQVRYPFFNAHFSTNSRGLRGSDVPLDRRPGRRRVLVLGDSFAWGHGVSESRAFPEVLEQMLPNCEVINLGMPGFDLRKSLVFYNRIGAAYQPDVVLLALCQNDARDHDAQRRKSAMLATPLDPSPARAGSTTIAMRRIKGRLCDQSHLFSLLRETVNRNKTLARAAVRVGIKEELAGFEFLDDNLRPALVHYPQTMHHAMDQLSVDLLAIDQTVRAGGARFLVALIPTLQAVDREELLRSIAYTSYETAYFDLDKPYETIQRFANQGKMPIVTPLSRFRQAFDTGRELYLPTDLHFNEAGHQLFAACIAPKLERLLPTPRLPQPPAPPADRPSR